MDLVPKTIRAEFEFYGRKYHSHLLPSESQVCESHPVRVATLVFFSRIVRPVISLRRRCRHSLLQPLLLLFMPLLQLLRLPLMLLLSLLLSRIVCASLSHPLMVLLLLPLQLLLFLILPGL